MLLLELLSSYVFLSCFLHELVELLKIDLSGKVVTVCLTNLRSRMIISWLGCRGSTASLGFNAVFPSLAQALPLVREGSANSGSL